MGRSASLQVLLSSLKLVVSVGLVVAGFAVTGALIGYSLSYVVAGAAGAVFPVSCLPLHPILLTLLGGAAYLLLFVPILAVAKALSSDDLASLETYFGGTGPFALLLRLGIRYYSLLAGG
jgi:hypothetical protein